MDLQPALQAALAAAREAGDLLRADFHRSGGPRGRVDKALADVEAERLIRSRLVGGFPGWGYVGEETGSAAGRAGEPIWLVDPNDGTRDYLEGRRGSAVSIGLLLERRPVLGVVHPFAYPDDEGEVFAWADGCSPLRRNGRPIEVRLPTRLAATDVVLVSSKGDRNAEANLRCAAPARFRSVVSIAHRLALVAAGEAAATTSVYAPGAWDYAAGHALLRSAGAVLLDETGREVTYAEDAGSRTRAAFAGIPAVARELSARPWSSVLGAGSGEAPLLDLERGAAADDPGRLGRAQGCLLGQIAGDSLGSLVEFESAAAIASRWGAGPSSLADGGVWGTLAGQPTDDSEMALALGRAIVERGGYEADAVLEAYTAWAGSGPFDVGGTVRAALAGRPNAASEANGSLMRASPLGVFAHRLPAEGAAALGRLDAGLTHPNRVCRDATAAFVVAVAHAVAHGDGPRPAYEAALEWSRRAGAAASVVGAIEAAAKSAPVCDRDHQGWALVALQNAFHELLHAADVEEGVVRTVRRGGDADTNAAIAGALLGAVHGRRAIPAQWRSMVLSCRPLPGHARRARPRRYWPVDCEVLAERLLLAAPTG
jgi:ADP-ribosylglycohydrolase/fructose-1,6-bisphosphatase/inositol monophosphatase family enzyme